MPLAGSFKAALGRRGPGACAPMWQGIHVVALAALVLRLAVACWSERISHPDELFQYLEQAHRLVYGYGFVPWEFRFGLRNWLLPGTLAALLEFLRLLGLDQPTIYVRVIKGAFAIVSVSVVYAGYAIGRGLFQEQTGRLAALFTAFWYELLYASTLATPEVLGTYAIFGGLAVLCARPGRRKTLVAGLLLGTSVALRLQYAAPAGALWMLVVLARGWRPALLLGISGAAVLAGAGALDVWSWGVPFISFYNNVMLNLVYGVSLIFGREPVYWYLLELVGASAGLYAIALAWGVLTWRKSGPVLLLIACVLIPHSLIAHKEYRFVFLAVPLFLVLLADAAADGLQRLGGVFAKRLAQPAAMAAVLAVSAPGCALTGVFERDDRLLAALDLSQRKDVAAVLDLTDEWGASGGFYYLHRNVPFYFEEHVEDLPLTDIRTLASHVLVSTDDDDGILEIPGFRIVARYDTVAILEQISPPATYRQLAKDGREPRAPDVEDHLQPTVSPRF